MSDRAPLIVYPLPPVLPGNPYLDLLYQPIAALGIHIRRDRPRHALPALLARRGPRIVHVHFFDELTQRPSAWATAARSMSFLALLRALRAAGIRLVWTAHNIEPHERFHAGWSDRVYRAVARASDVTITHSEAARAQIQARYAPRRTVVVPLGHYVGVYGPARDRAESRRVLGLPNDGHVTLCSGALRRYKNIEGLIDAFAALPLAQRGTLLVAGRARDRVYALELRQRASAVAGVRLDERYIPDAELPFYLGAADLVALPYHKMLTSAMLMLALSYARPVLAPALGPVAELISDGHEGLLYAPGAPAALTETLARALTSDLDTMAERAFARALTFDWNSIARATSEIYNDVARPSRPG
jgi:glycosyltransferase involved in cell wall biosynthesis